MLAARYSIDAQLIAAVSCGGLMIVCALYVIRSILQRRDESIVVLVLMIPALLLVIGIGITIPRMLLQERDEEAIVKHDLSEQGFDVVSVRAHHDMAEVRTPDDGIVAYQYRSDGDDEPYYLDGTTAIVIEAGTSFQATARLTPEDLPGDEGGE
jgi:hypothetical protein